MVKRLRGYWRWRPGHARGEDRSQCMLSRSLSHSSLYKYGPDTTLTNHHLSKTPLHQPQHLFNRIDHSDKSHRTNMATSETSLSSSASDGAPIENVIRLRDPYSHSDGDHFRGARFLGGPRDPGVYTDDYLKSSSLDPLAIKRGVSFQAAETDSAGLDDGVDADNVIGRLDAHILSKKTVVKSNKSDHSMNAAAAQHDSHETQERVKPQATKRTMHPPVEWLDKMPIPGHYVATLKGLNQLKSTILDLHTKATNLITELAPKLRQAIKDREEARIRRGAGTLALELFIRDADAIQKRSDRAQQTQMVADKYRRMVTCLLFCEENGCKVTLEDEGRQYDFRSLNYRVDRLIEGLEAE